MFVLWSDAKTTLLRMKLNKVFSTVCLHYLKVKPVCQVIWFVVFPRKSKQVKNRSADIMNVFKKILKLVVLGLFRPDFGLFSGAIQSRYNERRQYTGTEAGAV